MQCLSVYAKNTNEVDTMDTYWFPATSVTQTISNIQAGTFDLVASKNDANKKTGMLEGMEYY